MKTTWLIDKKSYACYYINLARQVQRGFFQNIRAIILPDPHPDAWSLPEYGLFANPEFITRLEATKDIITLNVQDPQLIQMVMDKISNIPSPKEVQESREELEKIYPEIEPYFFQIFRHFSQIKEIQFLLTNFGAGSSYFPYQDKDGKYIITITFRKDIGYQAAVKRIVSCMVYIEQEYDDQKLDAWTARKSISDFLMFNTKLKDYLPDITLAGRLAIWKSTRANSPKKVLNI